MCGRRRRRADLLVGVGDEHEARERQPAERVAERRDRVQAGEQAALHVGHAGAGRDAVRRSRTAARPRCPGRTPCPCGRCTAASGPSGSSPASVADDRVARGRGRSGCDASTVAPSVASRSAVQRADLVDAGLRVAPQSMLTSRSRSARKAAGSSTALGARRARSADEVGRGESMVGIGVAAVVSSVHRPTQRARPRSRILAGPCDSSRSACSRAPTSTGSSRWSRSRSPSGAARTWQGSRTPTDGALVHLGRTVPARDWPDAGRGPRRLDPPPPRGPRRARAARSTVHRAVGPGTLDRRRGRGPAPSGRGSSPRPRSTSPSRSPSRPGAASRLTGTQAAGRSTRWTGADRRRARHAARRGSATPTGRMPVDLDHRHQRQVDGDPADHPHPAAGRAARRDDDLRRDPGRRADGRGRRLDRPRRRGQTILRRNDVDVAVLETARGGLVLRGMGYESNDASVFTNVSSDHLDLQGIHTLPELAEVKSTICRVTKPDGWVVLNADDPSSPPSRAASGRRSPASRSTPTRSPVIARHRRAGGRAYVLAAGSLRRAGRRRRARDRRRRRRADRARRPRPPQRRQRARRGRRGAGAGRDASRRSPTGCATSGRRRSCRPGGMNLFRLGQRTVIVDFAHNEAGTDGDPRRRRGRSRAARRAGRRRSPRSSAPPATGPTTRSGASGGSRPTRAQRVAIKETLDYLRGREREDIVDAILAGIAEGGMDPATVPVYDDRDGGARGGARRVDGAVVAGRAGRRAAGRRAVLPRASARTCSRCSSASARAGRRHEPTAWRELSPRLADQRRR